MRERRKKRVDYTTVPDQAQQQYERECNINTIVRQARQGIPLSPLQLRQTMQPVYADLSKQPQSYFEAQMVIQDAYDTFYAMPAEVRDACRNDPEFFLSMAELAISKENRDSVEKQMARQLFVDLGLMETTEDTPTREESDLIGPSPTGSSRHSGEIDIGKLRANLGLNPETGEPETPDAKKFFESVEKRKYKPAQKRAEDQLPT